MWRKYGKYKVWMFETTKGSSTMRKDEQYQMKYEEVEPISFKQISL